MNVVIECLSRDMVHTDFVSLVVLSLKSPPFKGVSSVNQCTLTMGFSLILTHVNTQQQALSDSSSPDDFAFNFHSSLSKAEHLFKSFKGRGYLGLYCF